MSDVLVLGLDQNARDKFMRDVDSADEWFSGTSLTNTSLVTRDKVLFQIPETVLQDTSEYTFRRCNAVLVIIPNQEIDNINRYLLQIKQKLHNAGNIPVYLYLTQTAVTLQNRDFGVPTRQVFNEQSLNAAGVADKIITAINQELYQATHKTISPAATQPLIAPVTEETDPPGCFAGLGSTSKKLSFWCGCAKVKKTDADKQAEQALMQLQSLIFQQTKREDESNWTCPGGWLFSHSVTLSNKNKKKDTDVLIHITRKVPTDFKRILNLMQDAYEGKIHFTEAHEQIRAMLDQRVKTPSWLDDWRSDQSEANSLLQNLQRPLARSF